jgi:hypothetical protein
VRHDSLLSFRDARSPPPSRCCSEVAELKVAIPAVTEWPTSTDLLWLYAGLVPIPVFLWRALRHGFFELTSLGFIFILSLWVG